MKSSRYRRLLATLAVCLVIGGMVGLARLRIPVPVHPLRVVTMEWPWYYSLMRAQVDGHLTSIPDALIIKPDNPSVIEAFSRHDAEVITMVLSDAVMLAADGIDLRIIATLDYSDQSDVLLARPEFSEVKDLRGHEVAFEGVQTFSQLFVLNALARGGIAESMVTFRDVPAMQVPAEVKAGRLAAGHTWSPLAAGAVARGCHVLAKAGDDPGVRSRIARTLVASVERTKADELGTIAAAAACLKKKPEEIDPITGSVHLWSQAESLARMRGDAEPSIPARMALIVAQFRKRGQLSPNFRPERLIDTSLYQQGLRSDGQPP